MSLNPHDSFAKTFIEGMERTLLPAGFKRGGRGRFVRQLDGVTYIIQSQNSSSSNKSYLRITVNIGLSVESLSQVLGSKYPPKTEPDCHARSRIGSFLENPREDRWWGIADATEAASAAADIEIAIRDKVLPLLHTQASSASVLEAWEATIARPPFLFGGTKQCESFLQILRECLTKGN